MSKPPFFGSPVRQTKQRSLLSYCRERDTLLFSLKMSLIVGTILAAINHGQALLTAHFTFDRLVPLLLTYCVPFVVAMYSQVQGKRQRDLTNIQANFPEEEQERAVTQHEQQE